MNFDLKIKKSLKIIKKGLKLAAPHPLIVNFSGGKDSLCALHLVQQVTDNYICIFAKSSLDFPDVIRAVEETAKEQEIELYFHYKRQNYKI